ncbi:MAG TPA: hypothetical protein VJ044_03960, partial [Candidatus Hodarchaeales archaeon]|nr:hypothetical protein [Candidatus Hodarchaeales archaeon]
PRVATNGSSYATSGTPLSFNGTHYSLNSMYTYFSSSTLNVVKQPDNATAQELTATVGQSSFKFHTRFGYHNKVNNLFHDPSGKALGNVTADFEIEYDTNGMLTKRTERYFYQVVGLGEFLYFYQFLSAGGSSPGFELEYVFAGLSLVAIPVLKGKMVRKR